MKPYTKALIALTLVTAVTYGVLVGVGATHLVLGEARLKPFDLRVLGYTASDAEAYLALIKPSQVTLYTGFLRKLDTVFPLLFGLWLGWCLWGLTRRMHPWSRIILLVVPASYTLMELCENALVADMVLGFQAPVDTTLVALASSYTISKFVTLFVAFGLLLAMMLLKIRPFGEGLDS
ncbi:hypothetical protein [Shimia sediminis]|uniref:hypothetical protein n=1 Tax=Shimia sediminis TaxID=2497945 RepID=UPI000F8E319C|nr:hypothetical protein [Shimia sediminis]